MACRSQSSRFIYLLQCNKCNKGFDYRYLRKHKELFHDTLILIGVWNVKRCNIKNKTPHEYVFLTFATVGFICDLIFTYLFLFQ